jgi:hypothetical protein
VSNEPVDELLAKGDLDGLLRLIDEACDAGDWSVVEQIAERSRPAAQRGHQLWPAADHAEHRLALQGPAGHSARAVGRDATRFGIAPLAEVAASVHTWPELADHLPAGPLRATVAHERVARGEDLLGLALDADPLGLPLRLAAWEPACDGPTIGPYAIEDPVPPTGRLEAVDLPEAGTPMADPGTEALRDLVRTWTTESDGKSRAVCVRGTAPEAVAALAPAGLRMLRIEPGEALGRMAWAAASGGAHGRRRGAARGRFEMWWCAATLAGLLDDAFDGPGGDEAPWPPDAEELGDAVGELRWWLWDDGHVPQGWHLQLAVEDPADGLAWALEATDQA